MGGQLTPAEFHRSEATGDWHAVFTGACAVFSTRSFERGMELAREIARLAEAAHHHPDLDLRYAVVTVRLWSHDVDGLSERDVALAAAISGAARALGIEADPGAVQGVKVAVDAWDIPRVLPFWQAVLGYRRRGDADLVDGAGRGPSVWFQQLDEPRRGRCRLHVDVAVTREAVGGRVAAALEAGGRLVSDSHAPTWWTLADPEGNEVDVAVLAGRG